MGFASTAARAASGLALVLAVSACTALPRPAASDRTPAAEPTLVLISLDGFRWDFLERRLTPTLSRLAAGGVHAERLIPSFPTKTFPNHYTVVTGLRPSEHGLVANNIWDAERKLEFSLSNREAVGDGAWYGGEPIWVTAERQGLRTAALFWPGSEAEIGGVRPTLYRTYDRDMTPSERVDLILGWLDLPSPDRPRFLTLYFEDVDDAAHTSGPEPSERLAEALATVDSAVGRLVAGIERRELDSEVDLLIVSDHGMASTSADRLILLDDLVDVDRANVVDWNPVLGLWPAATDLDPVYEALAGAHPHLAVYRREELPARFEFSDHPRIPLILGIADEGWSITTRDALKRCPRCFDGGTHGYDHELASMGALLIGNGPSFQRGLAAGPTDNIHLYNLMCAILGIEPAENSGDPTAVAGFLRGAAARDRAVAGSARK